MDTLQAIYVADHVAPLLPLLDEVGWSYRAVPGPICCPVHKLGRESRPSAQVFDDNHIYCYTCLRQYGPVAVYAALKAIPPGEAARRLLARFPPTEGQLHAVLRTFRAPVRRPADQELLDHVERVLKRHRHAVPLAAYRRGARQANALARTLRGLPGEAQVVRVEFFCRKLEEDLKHAGVDPSDPLPHPGAAGVLS